MTASVVEAKATQSATAHTHTFATTPVAGDILVVSWVCMGSGNRTFTASGMGATWTTYLTNQGANNNMGFAVGINPTAAGNVVISNATADNQTSAVYLVRGTDGTGNIRLHTQTSAASGTVLAGPSQTANDGEFVCAALINNNTTSTWPDASSLPSQAAWTRALTFQRDAAYAIPSSTAAFQINATHTGTTAARIGQIVVGGSTFKAQVEAVGAEVLYVGNTAQVENVGAEALITPVAPTAQVENVLAEVLFWPTPPVVDPAYAAAVLADTPLAYYKLNDALSATVMTDSSGNNRHGTYSGASGRQDPIRPGGDYATKGGAAGQGIGSVANAAWMPVDTFSVEFWVQHNTTGDAVALVSKYSPGWIIWQRSGRLSLTMIPSSQQDKTGYPFSVGQVSHFVMVCVPGRVKAYVNGLLAWTYDWTGTFGPTHAPGLSIGNYGGGNYSQATMSDVAYYGVALTPRQVAAHYGAAYPAGAVDPASVSGLVGRYDANAITGISDGAAVAPWSDVSGNAKHLATVGAGKDPVLKTNILNGKSVVRFDGSNDALAGTVIPGGDTTTTIIAVHAVRTLGTIQTPVSMQGGVSTNSGPAMALGTTGLRAIFAVGSSIAYGGGQYVANTFERWAMVVNDLQSVLYVNDAVVENGPVIAAAAYLSLGASPTQGLWSSADIAEVLVYNRPLTDPEIYGIDEYLRTKWFIAAPPPGYVGWGVPMTLGPVAPAAPTAPSVVTTESILWLHNLGLGSAGSTVSTWPDSSPAARTVTYSTTVGNATVADASTPKGGKSVALPGGTGGPCFTIGASALATNRDGEVWMVLKSNDTGGNGSSKWGGDGSQMNHYGYGGSVYDDTGCTSRQSEPGTGIASWHVRRVKVAAPDRRVFVNGSQTYWTAVTPYWRQSPIVGGNGAASYFFNGNIAEVIQFPRALTDPEATAVLDYLNARHM